MDNLQIALVQNSFAKVVPIADTAAEIFYADLFATAPEVQPYFAGADMTAQGRKLMTTLGVVVRGLGNLDMVVPAARALAVRHVDYGVTPDDYEKVGASLLRTLEQGLGEDFTAATREAWRAAYSTVSAVMITAAYGKGEAAE